MNIVFFLLPMALLLSMSFVIAFIVSALRGQYDDLETPAHRLLLDDNEPKADTTLSNGRTP